MALAAPPVLTVGTDGTRHERGHELRHDRLPGRRRRRHRPPAARRRRRGLGVGAHRRLGVARTAPAGRAQPPPHPGRGRPAAPHRAAGRRDLRLLCALLGRLVPIAADVGAGHRRGHELRRRRPHLARRRRRRGADPGAAAPRGWEWAGFWLSLVGGFDVTAVVEPLEPPDLFDFFTAFREELGMHIVALGPDAGAAVLRAINEAHVLCLLADRDIEGTGIEVDFFGERTTLPAGPATLALRTGAPLLPTACYFKPTGGIQCLVEPPVPARREAKRLREDVTRITQDLARALEGLIRRAPEQWHMQQPNWPSDYDALEAIGKPHPRPGQP
ncbi:MAG: hypothetical protein R2699_14260 [Acidimicrobiales bacterium]